MERTTLPADRTDVPQGAAILACNMPAAAEVADAAPCQKRVRGFDATAVMKIKRNAMVCG
jgi:hypothetical protein